MSTANSSKDAISGFSSGNVGWSTAIICLGIASIGLFIKSIVDTSDFIGNTENWRAIKPQIKKIWWSSAVGAAILFIGMFLFVLQFEKTSVVFILLISCIAIALSFSAISVSAISTSGATPSG